MAEYPALDLRLAEPAGCDLRELLYAELDAFEPMAIDEDETGGVWRVHFREASRRDAAAVALAARFGSRLASVCAVSVDDGDWARRSQASLTSVRVGRVIVAPPWDAPAGAKAPAPADEAPPRSRGAAPPPDIPVLIEPSMGFGTGHHATTRLCLALLQTAELAGRTVLDVGTGSGVLAIAARLLGAASVTAIDDDPDALQSARENIARNAVGDAVRTACCGLGAYRTPADVVLANLTGAVLERHAGALAALVRPGGSLIVSGFSPVELEEIVKALGARVDRDLAEEEWAAALVRPE